MTIRPATTDDIPAVVAMGQHFLQDSPYRPLLAENPAQMTTLAQLLIDTGVVLVAERQDGDLVGMLGAHLAPHFISGELVAGEVFWWVEPQWRGSIGVRLLRSVEAWAQQHGAVALQMIAPDPHVEAFYARVGYQPIERSYWRRFNAA